MKIKLSFLFGLTTVIIFLISGFVLINPVRQRETNASYQYFFDLKKFYGLNDEVTSSFSQSQFLNFPHQTFSDEEKNQARESSQDELSLSNGFNQNQVSEETKNLNSLQLFASTQLADTNDIEKWIQDEEEKNKALEKEKSLQLTTQDSVTIKDSLLLFSQAIHSDNYS
jgi:hypothetical protein